MKKGLKKILPGTGAVLLLLAGGVMAGAAGKEQEYIFPEVDKELLTEEDVKDLPAELLAYGRYEILAKHGELFESEELKEYFGNQEWYFGFLSDEKEVEGLLNDIEKENLAFLEKKEKAEGGYELDQKDFDYEIVKKWLEGTYVAGEETTRKTSEKKTKETEAAKTAETEAPATEAPTEPVTEAPATEPATEAPAEPETEEHVTDGKFEDLSDVDLFSLSQDELCGLSYCASCGPGISRRNPGHFPGRLSEGSEQPASRRQGSGFRHSRWLCRRHRRLFHPLLPR